MWLEECSLIVQHIIFLSDNNVLVAQAKNLWIIPYSFSLYQQMVSLTIKRVIAQELLTTFTTTHTYTHTHILTELLASFFTTSYSLYAQIVKNLPAMKETWVQSLGPEDPLEKGMSTHSGILAWRIPWTQELGRLQFMGSIWVENDWTTNTSIGM